MAERVGFEPTVAFTTSVFKTDAIDHSATSPRCVVRGVHEAITGGNQVKVKINFITRKMAAKFQLPRLYHDLS